MVTEFTLNHKYTEASQIFVFRNPVTFLDEGQRIGTEEHNFLSFLLRFIFLKGVGKFLKPIFSLSHFIITEQ